MKVLNPKTQRNNKDSYYVLNKVTSDRKISEEMKKMVYDVIKTI